MKGGCSILQGVELTVGRKAGEGPDTKQSVPRERGPARGRLCNSNGPRRPWDDPEQLLATGAVR